MEFKNIELSDLQRVTAEIIDSFPQIRIFLLDAPMGGGKTTVIRRFCKKLGVEEEVTSPTFAIANVYLGKENSEVYHFDFYRLVKPEDAFQIGFYEYLETGNYCFLEWPEIIQPFINEKYLKISIIINQNPLLRDIKVSLFD